MRKLGGGHDGRRRCSRASSCVRAERLRTGDIGKENSTFDFETGASVFLIRDATPSLLEVPYR